MKRLNYVDNLRAISIIGMVLCHMTIYLAPETDPFDAWYFVGNHLMGDWPAALFLVISGYMLGLKANKKASYLVKRGIFIVAAGFFLSIVNSGPEGILECDILIIIGVFQILSIWIGRLKSKHIIIMIVLISIAAVLLRHVFGYYDMWGGERNLVNFQDVLIDPGDEYGGEYFDNAFRSLTLNGYFPLFPWLSFLLIGLLFGRRKEVFDKKLMVILGFICLLLSTVLISYGAYNRINDLILSIFPLSISAEILLVGLILLIFAANNIINGYSKILFTFSRSSLTVYTLQYLIISVLTYGFGFTLDCKYRLLFGTSILIILYILLRMWSKYDLRFSLEDIMGRVCK